MKITLHLIKLTLSFPFMGRSPSVGLKLGMRTNVAFR